MNWLVPLLYLASYAAIFILFASTVFIIAWGAVRLRKLLVRLLGGRLRE